jgi:hypothetical protein
MAHSAMNEQQQHKNQQQFKTKNITKKNKNNPIHQPNNIFPISSDIFALGRPDRCSVKVMHKPRRAMGPLTPRFKAV